jgi:hypothetical protein
MKLLRQGRGDDAAKVAYLIVDAAPGHKAQRRGIARRIAALEQDPEYCAVLYCTVQYLTCGPAPMELTVVTVEVCLRVRHCSHTADRSVISGWIRVVVPSPSSLYTTVMTFVVNILGVSVEGRLEVGGAVGWVRDIVDPHHGPAGGRGGDYPCGVIGWDGASIGCNGGSLQELCMKLIHAPGGYSAVGQPCDQIHRHVQAAEDNFMRLATGETKDTEGMSQMACPPHEDDGDHRRRDRESSPAEVLDSGGVGVPVSLSLSLLMMPLRLGVWAARSVAQ